MAGFSGRYLLSHAHEENTFSTLLPCFKIMHLVTLSSRYPIFSVFMDISWGISHLKIYVTCLFDCFWQIRNSFLSTLSFVLCNSIRFTDYHTISPLSRSIVIWRSYKYSLTGKKESNSKHPFLFSSILSYNQIRCIPVHAFDGLKALRLLWVTSFVSRKLQRIQYSYAALC